MNRRWSKVNEKRERLKMNNITNPAMIILGRESRGFSQTDLATRMNVSQAAVSKFEKGQLQLEGELLDRLSNALNYPREFFCQMFNLYPLPLQFFRKHKTLPAKTARRIQAQLDLLRLHAGQMLGAAEIDFTPVPLCDVDVHGSPREIAKSVRQYLRLPRGPVMNLTEELEKLGILVVHFDARTPQFSGVSTDLGTNNYLIIVNKQMTGARLRWTLAHEFGHIVMHRLPTPDMENEANAFAGEFLMPGEEIAPELNDVDVPKLASLKRHYKVSMTGILTNGIHSGAISEWKQRRLWVELAKRGITRRSEPLEELVPVEQPSLMDELIDFHLNDLDYSIEGLASVLGLHLTEFVQLYNPSVKRLQSIGDRPKLSIVR